MIGDFRDHGRRIALACGGTAGHVSPALAIADAYRRLVPGPRKTRAEPGTSRRYASAIASAGDTCPAVPPQASAMRRPWSRKSPIVRSYHAVRRFPKSVPFV